MTSQIPENQDTSPKTSRVWENSNDVHVRNYIIYVNDQHVACFDPEGLFPVSAEKLSNFYLKSLLISDNGVLYTAISMMTMAGRVAITYFIFDPEEPNPTLSYVLSYDESPVVDGLALVSLSVSSDKSLIPDFSPDVFEYTLLTSFASSTVEYVASSRDAVVLIDLDGDEITDLQDINLSAGEHILTITLTLGEVETVYTITITHDVPPVVEDLALVSLSVSSDKSLTPTFSSDILEYTLLTSYASCTVEYVASSIDATVVVNFDGDDITTLEDINLSAGEHILIITLTLDDVETVYTVTITQQDPPYLPSLTIGDLELTPEFLPYINEYTSSTTDTSDLIDLEVLPVDSSISITNNNVEVEDFIVTWVEGENVIIITLEKNGIENVYTVTVTNPNPVN